MDTHTVDNMAAVDLHDGSAMMKTERLPYRQKIFYVFYIFYDFIFMPPICVSIKTELDGQNTPRSEGNWYDWK